MLQQWLADRQVSPGHGVLGYEPHRPGQTHLYQLGEQHHLGVGSQLAAQGGLWSEAPNAPPFRQFFPCQEPGQ
jgi:hypothetical protein